MIYVSTEPFRLHVRTFGCPNFLGEKYFKWSYFM